MMRPMWFRMARITPPSLHRRWRNWARWVNGLQTQRSEPQVVFVLSTGRCGTMTLAELAKLSPGVDAHHEPFPTLWHTSAIAARVTLEGNSPGCISEAIRAVFLDSRGDQIAATLSRGLTYFESNHRLTFLAPWIAEQYPNSKFIVMTRHPYPYVTSSLRRQHYAGHVLDDVFLSPTPGSPAHAAWAGWHPAQKAAWQWATTYAHALGIEAALGNRVMRMASESLFAGDADSLSRLFAFLGQPVPILGVDSVLSQKLNRQEERLDCDIPADLRTSVRELVCAMASKLSYGLE